MARIRKRSVTLAPVGGAGVATAGQQLNLGRPGILRFARIDYGATVPATADVRVLRDSSAGAVLLTRTDSATDIGPLAVGSAGMDEAQAASAVTDGLAGGFAFSNGLYVDVAQADPSGGVAAKEVVVDLWMEHCRKKDLTLTTDGAGDATLQWSPGRPGVVRFLAVDYSATAGASMTMTIKRDSTAGAVIFTKDANETDFGPTAVGTTAGNGTFAPTAATDALTGGLPYTSGLFITIAAGGASKITTVSVWYDG